MKLHFIAVPEVLRRDVEAFVLGEFNSMEDVEIKVFPKGVPGIVFHQNDQGTAIRDIVTRSGVDFTPPGLFLHGAGTEPSVMRFRKGAYTTIQIILKPHALCALFGLNAGVVAHQSVELNEFLIDDLIGRLHDAVNGQERIALLSAFLIAKWEQGRPRDVLVEESLRLIHKDIYSVTVKSLLAALDISERQFERRFSQVVGLTPWSYIRTRRFNEAVRLIESGEYTRLTDIAYALNYHDQSHFIREVKKFSGVLPKNLSIQNGVSG